MQRKYSVRLAKDYLVFSAAHFITYQSNVCERLHGHNYHVEAVVEGPLDENYYVIDFIALRDMLKELVDELDHRVLLPTQHREIHVDVEGNEVVSRFQERRWVFPREDCRMLPVPNTTAEMLATYLSEQLIERFTRRGLPHPERLRVGVDENGGQWGIVETTWSSHHDSSG